MFGEHGPQLTRRPGQHHEQRLRPRSASRVVRQHTQGHRAGARQEAAAGEQRDKWTKQLDEFASEGNKMGAQLADLEAKKLDLKMQLEDALEEFELVPTPKKP